MKIIELSDREADHFMKWLISAYVEYSNNSKDPSPMKDIKLDVVIGVQEQLEDQGVEP